MFKMALSSSWIGEKKPKVGRVFFLINFLNKKYHDFLKCSQDVGSFYIILIIVGLCISNNHNQRIVGFKYLKN